MQSLSDEKFIFYGDSNELIVIISMLRCVKQLLDLEQQGGFVAEGILQITDKLQAAYTPQSPNHVKNIGFSFTEIGFLIRMLLRASDHYEPIKFVHDPVAVLHCLQVRSEITNFIVSLMACKRSDGKAWEEVY